MIKMMQKTFYVNTALFLSVLIYLGFPDFRGYSLEKLDIIQVYIFNDLYIEFTDSYFSTKSKDLEYLKYRIQEFPT